MGTRTTRGIGLAVLALATAVAPASGAADDAGRLGTNQIVFSSLRGATDEIYVKDVDGSHERQLTSAPGQDGGAMVSPDRRTIAFGSERTGLMQLWAMDADGGNQRQLLVSDTFDFHPAWSHDGASILFQRRGATGFDLWVLDLATGAQRQLTSLPRNEVGGFFSPDDRTVVFGGNNGTSNDVWTVPAAGGTPVALTADVCVTGIDPCRLALDVQPSWTPDGRILFLSDRTGGIGIWTMAADGGDARLVIDLGEEAAVGMPYMSANGQRITFVTNVHDVEGDRNVYTVRSDGRQLRRLSSPGDDLGPTFASGA